MFNDLSFTDLSKKLVKLVMLVFLLIVLFFGKDISFGKVLCATINPVVYYIFISDVSSIEFITIKFYISSLFIYLSSCGLSFVTSYWGKRNGSK